MGTNYYAQGKVECEQCGSKHTCREAIHLGKSSMGWKFTFAWNGGQYYKSVPEMQEWLKTKTCWDEYGKQITVEEFWQMVEAKKDAELDYITYKDKRGEDASQYGVVVDGIFFMDGYFS